MARNTTKKTRKRTSTTTKNTTTTTTLSNKQRAEELRKHAYAAFIRASTSSFLGDAEIGRELIRAADQYDYAAEQESNDENN